MPLMCRNIAVSIIRLVAIGLTLQAAGKNAEEEAAVRKMIAAIDAAGNRSHSLPDSIFWSGVYKQPVIGSRDDKTMQLDGEGRHCHIPGVGGFWHACVY